MKQMTSSAHPTWLFTLRMIGMIGRIAMILVGLSVCQSGNARKPDAVNIIH